MASKPKKADSNTSSSGNEKVIKKAKDAAEIKRMTNPHSTLKDVQNIVRGAVLMHGLAKAVNKANSYEAYNKGESVKSSALDKAAKSPPKPSKTISVPKRTKVITSSKTGSANATSGVNKVTIQKSPARVQAGIKSNADIAAERTSRNSLTASNARAKGAVDGATIAIGIKNITKGKKKK